MIDYRQLLPLTYIMLLKQIEEDTKYLLTLKRPFKNEIDFVRVRVIQVFIKENESVPHGVTYREIPRPDKLSPKHIVYIPFDWIVSAETLNDIIGSLFIKDIVLTIDEYV